MRRLTASCSLLTPVFHHARTPARQRHRLAETRRQMALCWHRVEPSHVVSAISESTSYSVKRQHSRHYVCGVRGQCPPAPRIALAYPSCVPQSVRIAGRVVRRRQAVDVLNSHAMRRAPSGSSAEHDETDCGRSPQSSSFMRGAEVTVKPSCS
jgi:hypothetical protein